MKNKEIAVIFESVADLMEILGEDRFRINSYRKVSRIVGDLTEAIEDVAADDRLQSIAGVGKSTAAKITEYLGAGRIDLHEQLLAKVPPGLPALLGVPGLGPKTVAKLWRQADITSIAELKSVYSDDPQRLTQVDGLGVKKSRQIWESLMFMESVGGRILLGQADELAGRLLAEIAASKGAKRVAAAGSLRRGKETIGDIDLLCEAPKSRGAEIITRFAEADGVRRVLAKGATKGSVVLEGDVQVDLRVVATKSFGSALAYFTGSKEHNVRLRELATRKGLKLNEYGLFKGDEPVAGADEGGIYAALGLDWIAPELREDRGEIEAALAGQLPELIELGDVRGDLHVHSTASDGLNTIDEMIAACRDRGYAYVGFCDHSKSQVQAHGLDERRLAEHAAAIRAAGKAYDDIVVLAGIEVDIFKDGTLDFEADVLAELDWVTASAHSALGLGRKETTHRLIRAIEHRQVNCIGHPSGRIIHGRPGMELDIEAIAKAAADNCVALEINAHYMRLDLRDTHVRAAVEAGAKICINTDAHNIADLDMMHYGVTVARRGWATSADAINTWPPDRLRDFLGKK